MAILCPPGGQDRENRPGGYPEQGRGCEPQPAALIEPDHAEGHVSQHGTDQQHGQDPDSPLLEDADHGNFASEPTTISVRPRFAYSLLAILDPAQTAGSWGTELVPTRNRDDATISMESGQEPPPGSLTDVDQRLLEYCPRGPGRRARVGRILFLAGIRDPPDGTRAVVSHKQRAVRRHGHADRTAPDVSFLGDETDQEVFVLSCRLAVFHWHADHFVARPAGTIPRAMLGSKRVQPVHLRELTAVIEGQIERRRVRLNKNVGNNHLVLEFRVFSFVPGVLIRPKVVPWPAVETAFLDVGDIVGHEIVTQPVALVSRSPELPGPGMNRQAHGIANARGEGPLVLAVRVEGENHSAALFGGVVVDIRPRADRDIQGLAVGRELQVTGPVATTADFLSAGRDVLHDHLGPSPRLGVAIAVGEAHHRAGVADIEEFWLRARREESNSKRAVQPSGKNLVHLGLAVAVGIPEDAQPAGPALGNKEVAVGCPHDHPRLDQPVGELRHREAFGSLGPCPLGPLHDPWTIVRRGSVVGGGKISNRDLATDARRISRPVAESVLALQGDVSGASTISISHRYRLGPEGTQQSHAECEDRSSYLLAHRGMSCLVD